VHLLLGARERARELGDDRLISVGLDLCVCGALDPEDVARDLDDRALEAASGSDERHAPLAGEADRSERAVHPAGRDPRADEDAVETLDSLPRGIDLAR
jgi:hypothetical protein